MGEAKRRKARGIDGCSHRWSAKTDAKIAAVCGGDVRLDEVCTLGWVIAAGGMDDPVDVVSLLEDVYPRTRRENWPRLIEAARTAANDPVFVSVAEPFYEEWRGGAFLAPKVDWGFE
jgi:hypothetical protein